MKKVISMLGAIAVVCSVSSAFALPMNSMTPNGNYIVFNFDKSLNQHDNRGQVQVYQNSSELMLKFTNNRAGSNTKQEHVIKYKLRRNGSGLSETDKIMVENCIEFFKKASESGTIFYLMVDARGATSCALDVTM